MNNVLPVERSPACPSANVNRRRASAAVWNVSSLRAELGGWNTLWCRGLFADIAELHLTLTAAVPDTHTD